MSKFVEIRAYTLKSGSGEEFHRLVVENALPMLAHWQIDVVACGPSLHDADSYYLIRAFSSLEDRQSREDAFYGSDEWRQGHREAVLALIETYTEVVIQLEDTTVDGLRKRYPVHPSSRTPLPTAR